MKADAGSFGFRELLKPPPVLRKCSPPASIPPSRAPTPRFILKNHQIEFLAHHFEGIARSSARHHPFIYLNSIDFLSLLTSLIPELAGFDAHVRLPPSRPASPPISGVSNSSSPSEALFPAPGFRGAHRPYPEAAQRAWREQRRDVPSPLRRASYSRNSHPVSIARHAPSLRAESQAMPLSSFCLAPGCQRSRRAASLHIRDATDRRTPAWRNFQEIHQRRDAAIIGTGREIGVEAPAQGANTLPMKTHLAFLRHPGSTSDLDLEIRKHWKPSPQTCSSASAAPPQHAHRERREGVAFSVMSRLPIHDGTSNAGPARMSRTSP